MIYDLIIIGAGPAGTAAAVYGARQKLNMIIISKDVGGQVAKKAVDIENYPGFNKISGPDLTKIFADQIKENKVEIILDEVLKIEKIENNFLILTSQNKKYEATAVIVTTGSDPRPLEVPGEKEFIGKGVSYCSLCDGPIFRDKTVAVIGGGNSGFETALFLSNYVKKIYLLEFGENPRADQENQELIKKNGKTEVITSAKVLKIEGDPMVNSLTYQDTKTEEEKKIDVEGVFIEIGYSPATAFVKGLVDFSERDEILAEPETFQTKTPGLFAAGDCNKGKYKQIVIATGEGAKAALSAYEYIQRTKN
jgi:thioredoxin-disulfide reductase